MIETLDRDCSAQRYFVLAEDPLTRCVDDAWGAWTCSPSSTIPFTCVSMELSTYLALRPLAGHWRLFELGEPVTEGRLGSFRRCELRDAVETGKEKKKIVQRQ